MPVPRKSAPVPALKASRAAAAPSAATVIMFDRPGLAGRGVPGVFANYKRKGSTGPTHDCAEGKHWPCTAVTAARQAVTV